MKSQLLRNLVMFIVLSILFPIVLPAQEKIDYDIDLRLDPPPTIPSDVRRHIRKDLNIRRDDLLGQFNGLTLRISEFNSRCVNVSSKNENLLEECRTNFFQLRIDAASYSTRVKAFRIAIDREVEGMKNLLDDIADDYGLSQYKLIRAFTNKAIDASLRGDYTAAIGYYKAALKIKPGNRDLQIALGAAMHSRDKQGGKKVVNPKAEFIFIALEHGHGEWERSIAYLEDILLNESGKDNKQAVNEALNYIKGCYAYQQYQDSRDEEKLTADLDDLLFSLSNEGPANFHLRKGYKQLEAGNFKEAINHFKDAKVIGGKYFDIQNILSYTEGIRDAKLKEDISH